MGKTGFKLVEDKEAEALCRCTHFHSYTAVKLGKRCLLGQQLYLKENEHPFKLRCVQMSSSFTYVKDIIMNTVRYLTL